MPSLTQPLRYLTCKLLDGNMSCLRWHVLVLAPKHVDACVQTCACHVLVLACKHVDAQRTCVSEDVDACV